MLFWFVLTGSFTAPHLVAGLAVVAVSQAIARLLLPRAADELVAEAPPAKFWIRLPGVALALIGELMRELVLANWRVATIVLRRRMPIQPVFYSYSPPVKTEWGRVALANSVTLTPGTLTVELGEGTFLVHGLTPQAAASLPGWAVERRLEHLERLARADP
jgi:multicomponent Na+:H+ antiporter subunit E